MSFSRASSLVTFPPLCIPCFLVFLVEIAQRPLRSRGTGSEAGAIVVKYDLEAETVSPLPRPEGVFTDLSFRVIVFTWHSVHRVFLGEDAIVGIGESEGRRDPTDAGKKFIIHNVSGSSTEAEERRRRDRVLRPLGRATNNDAVKISREQRRMDSDVL